jgi:hypothetical protein
MFMSHHETTRLNHYIRLANTFTENVAKFEYLGTTVILVIHTHKEMKSSLN